MIPLILASIPLGTINPDQISSNTDAPLAVVQTRPSGLLGNTAMKSAENRSDHSDPLPLISGRPVTITTNKSQPLKNGNFEADKLKAFSINSEIAPESWSYVNVTGNPRYGVSGNNQGYFEPGEGYFSAYISRNTGVTLQPSRTIAVAFDVGRRGGEAIKSSLAAGAYIALADQDGNVLIKRTITQNELKQEPGSYKRFEINYKARPDDSGKEVFIRIGVDGANISSSNYFDFDNVNVDLPIAYPYVSIQAGAGFPRSLTADLDFLGLATFKNTLDLNAGFNGELAVGYKFPKFRSDLSVGYSSFGSDKQTITVNGFGTSTVNGIGSVDLFTVMINGYYDFKIKNSDGSLSRWSPYLGAGIGWGRISTPGCAIPGGCTLFSSGSEQTFVYQAKLGLAYQVTNSGFAFVEGGYLGTSSVQIQNSNYNPLGAWRLNLGWRQRF